LSKIENTKDRPLRQEESFIHNTRSREEIVVDASGKKNVKRFLPNGLLREEVEIEKGHSTFLRKISYNEQFYPIREIRGDITIEYNEGPPHRISRILKSGNVIYKTN